MSQKQTWEKEYTENRLVTMSDKPQQDFLNFLKFLRKKHDFVFDNKKVLDLGCGVGKNSIHLAKHGADAIGIDISSVAIGIARERAAEADLSVDFRTGDIGSKYPFPDGYFDLVIDVMSSNSLSEKEREIYLAEIKRVLKPGGFLFVRTLKLEGDKNAKNLLSISPAKEKNAYTIKEMNLTERVFTEQEIRELYGKQFQIEKLESKSSYARYKNQSYKRNYWILTATNK